MSDHFVSEAIYLRDPDAHGIEIYWDRPREVWEGQVARALDHGAARRPGPGCARSTTVPFDGLAGGTVMGHVHLRVAEVPATVAFYSDVLGLGRDGARSAGRRSFLSAGGYHHHVGANTWESAGAPPAPEGTARLRRTTLVLPDVASRDRLAAQAARAGFPVERQDDSVGLTDPSGNPLSLSVQP